MEKVENLPEFALAGRQIPQKVEAGRPMREESFLSGWQVSIFGKFFHNVRKKSSTNGYCMDTI
jgi:hypothetical protein